MEFFEGLNAPLLENDRHVRRSFYPEGMVRRFHGDVDFPWTDMDANDGRHQPTLQRPKVLVRFVQCELCDKE